MLSSWLHKINTSLISLFLISLIIIPNLSQAFEFNKSLNEAGSKMGYDKTGGKVEDPVLILQKPIIMIMSLVAVLFLILTIYGGFLWMSAKGEAKQVDKAKEIIKAAVIGVILTSMAYAISIFVMARLGNIGGATLK